MHEQKCDEHLDKGQRITMSNAVAPHQRTKVGKQQVLEVGGFVPEQVLEGLHLIGMEGRINIYLIATLPIFIDYMG